MMSATQRKRNVEKISYMDTYTKEQRLIVRTKKKHTEVSAYAGTGKTKTLCGRIHWLFDQSIPASQILVLSFSNNAVDILVERLAGQVTVQTFHAFAHGLVREHHRTLGLSNKSQLITPTQRLALIAKAVKNSPDQRRAVRRETNVKLNTKEEVLRLAAFYTKAQGNRMLAKSLVIDPNSEFLAYRKVLKPLRQIHREYRKLKLAASLIDYTDMLRHGRKAIEQGNGVPYQYLFVDECQDMSREQAEMLRVLAIYIPNIMVFGDPYQGVFGFAGGRYWQLSSLMDNVQTYSLTQSFRLTQRNADLASAIIAPLSGKPVPILGRKSGRQPVLIRCETIQGQTQKVLDVVQNIRCNGKNTAGIAILARTKAQLREVEIALLNAGYPIDQRHRLPAPKHMDTLLDILTLLEEIAARITNHRKIHPKKLEMRLLRVAGLSHTLIDQKVIAACRRKLGKATLSPTLEGRYIGVRKVYEKLLRHHGSLTIDLRAELGRWEPLLARFACTEALRKYVSELRKVPPITTSTIHRAKGGEWDHVLVLGITDGSLPFYREIERGELDEERRLLYVAASRPRERLFLIHAPYHHGMSGRKYESPSRFLTPDVSRLLRKE